jgi:hypothetical protein
MTWPNENLRTAIKLISFYASGTNLGTFVALNLKHVIEIRMIEERKFTPALLPFFRSFDGKWSDVSFRSALSSLVKLKFITFTYDSKDVFTMNSILYGFVRQADPENQLAIMCWAEMANDRCQVAREVGKPLY